MKKKQDILTQITELTVHIETNYPELYVFLTEDPITIPSTKDPKINNKVMEDYLESLKQILKNYSKTHKSI